MKTAPLLLAAALALAGCGSPTPPPPVCPMPTPAPAPTAAERADGDVLRAADMFYGSDMVGIAGTIPLAVQALRRLVAAPGGRAVLAEAAVGGPLHVRLLALCGLRSRDAAAYGAIAGGLARERGAETVEVISGCIVSRVPLHEVLDRMEGRGEEGTPLASLLALGR